MEDEEEQYNDFPNTYTKLKDDSRKIKEESTLDWMDAKIKIKEVDISNDNRPKLVKIGDYWSEEKTIDIINLLKEYQDVFARDYIDIKGLVQEMDHMKI